MSSPIQQDSFINYVGNGLCSIASQTSEIVKLTAKTALSCIGIITYIFSLAVFFSIFFPIGVPVAVAVLPFFGKLAVSLVAGVISTYFYQLAGTSTRTRSYSH